MALVQAKKRFRSQVRKSDPYLRRTEEPLESQSVAQAGLWMDQQGPLRGCAVMQARDKRPDLGKGRCWAAGMERRKADSREREGRTDRT